METKCPSCGEIQWSPMDKKYVTLFGHCWEEDRIRWEAGKLSEREFDEREVLAINMTVSSGTS